MKKRFPRREFIKTGIAVTAAAPLIVPSTVLGRDGTTPPNEKVVLGSVGVGVRGCQNLRQFMQRGDVHVAAVCDVSGQQRLNAKQLVDTYYEDENCSAYNDFRELIAREDIDLISVATPDHWHALVGLAAAHAGKDLYYEKPVGVSFEQAKTLRAAIHRYQNVFQFGTQQRSTRNFRFACELVRNGRIGTLKTIYVGAPASRAIPQDPIIPVPDGFDYDMWLGPAQKVPYSYQRCRPHNDKESWSCWYHIRDYCLGFIVNWGIHHLDIAQWGNGTDSTTPVDVEGSGKFPKDGMANCCLEWELEFNYANGVKLIYSDNKGRCEQGVRFEGDEGWVHVSRSKLEAHPKSLLESKIDEGENHLIKSDDPYENLLNAIRDRSGTVCPIDSAVRSDTICQMADIGSRLQRKLCWNPEKEEFIGDAEANKMLSRSMREPWTLAAFS